ncbi:hypothetical protein [Natrinema altunense]|uniref:hypothetical protein n=1 Tax=Natrinema altunense TaxID=222984 RepID=UPI000AC4F732|nr:hypothetical protein [Natrinema altunense]
MSDSRDAGGDTPPECPDCGEPMLGMRVVGPTVAYAMPCGCSFAPGLLADGFENEPGR